MKNVDPNLAAAPPAPAASQDEQMKGKPNSSGSQENDCPNHFFQYLSKMPVDLGPGFASISETQAWLGGIGRTTLYALMKSPKNPLPRPVRLGGRAVFPVELIIAWRASFLQDQLKHQDRRAFKP